MQKFYENNRDIFLRYFDDVEQYDALIAAGNFRKIKQIIDEAESQKETVFGLSLSPRAARFIREILGAK